MPMERWDIHIQIVNHMDCTTTIEVIRNFGPSGFQNALTYIYNYDRIKNLSTSLLEEIDLVVVKRDLTEDAIRAGGIRSLLYELNTLLYRIYFHEIKLSLGELFLEARNCSFPRSTSIGVNQTAQLIPWELSSPSNSSNISDLLGTWANVTGTLVSELRKGVVLRSATKVRSRINYNIKDIIVGIENNILLGAEIERDLVLTPTPVLTGSIAPPISAKTDEIAFFKHIMRPDPSIFHIFCHCDHDEAGFNLIVSNDYFLTAFSFYSHKAILKTNSYFFLNVCSSAPSAITQSRSILEYIDTQQHAGGVIATLTSVRSDKAAEMACAFYKSFMPVDLKTGGETAFQALRVARDRLATDGSLVGYLYRLYGRPDVRMSNQSSEEDASRW